MVEENLCNHVWHGARIIGQLRQLSTCIQGSGNDHLKDLHKDEKIKLSNNLSHYGEEMDLVWCGLIANQTLYLFNAKSSLYIYIKYIWFGWVLCHINHCRLFNAKSSLYIYIEYIWFGLVGFYGISTIVVYLMPNPLYTYILNIWFGLVGFYGISTIVGYLMPNPFYAYIINIYDLVWLDFMA